MSKTLDQKANELAQQFCDETHVISMDGIYAQKLVEIIKAGLEQQDHDTRHTCAERVYALPYACSYVEQTHLINGYEAKEACINAIAK